MLLAAWPLSKLVAWLWSKLLVAWLWSKLLAVGVVEAGGLAVVEAGGYGCGCGSGRSFW
jgi:hypothetical protein